MATLSLRFMALCVISTLLFVCTSFSADAEDLPQVITYSAGYRINEANTLELGIINRCGDAWCVKIAWYEGAKNIPRTPTRYRHMMKAPYRSPGCQDQPIGTIIPSESQEYTTRLKQESNGFVVEVGQFQYHWVADPHVVDAYVLTNVTQAASSGIVDQVVGFAFASGALVKGPIKPAQLVGRFNGDIFHKDFNMGVVDDWLSHPSKIDFGRFAETTSSEVLMMTQSGQPDVIKKYGKPMWQQNSFVLTRDEGLISPLVQEYGHDFNMNGCFDELGHIKLLLPVLGESNAMRALVYIEYTPNKVSGMPMISVGRYYR